MKRSSAMDFARGLVMIIMALDHTRDLIHVSSIVQSPTNLATTTPILFFTRWITHLCAPAFVFLSGTSAYLSFKKKNNPAESKRFLLSRGIWLIILEFTIVNFGVWFDVQFRLLFFQVIAAIGFGFIILSLLLKKSIKVIAITGLIIIFGCNLLNYIPPGNTSLLRTIISPLFLPTGYTVTPNFTFFIGYPIIPWLGIMLLGFASGGLFELPPEKRKSIFFKIGIITLALFTLLRFVNLYGDPSKWAIQKKDIFTFLSFINVTKYPPSLLFSLITLSIMFLILSLAERIKNIFTDVVIVYGKVPLFYYLIHWYIVHSILLIILFSQGFHWHDLQFGPFNFGRPKQESGLPLWGVYIVWISVVIFMYPLCKWYGKYKQAHPEKKWLRYL
jgi:uncharacterized membrane protein